MVASGLFSAADFDRSDITNIIVVCDQDDCRSPVVCDSAREECVECLDDTECTAPDSCVAGVCFEP